MSRALFRLWFCCGNSYRNFSCFVLREVLVKMRRKIEPFRLLCNKECKGEPKQREVGSSSLYLTRSNDAGKAKYPMSTYVRFLLFSGFSGKIQSRNHCVTAVFVGLPENLYDKGSENSATWTSVPVLSQSLPIG